jgi:hypothetical protein
VGLPSSTSRPVIEQLISQSIAKEELVESALEFALIGFEEASDKRVYLFNLFGREASTLPSSLMSMIGGNVSDVRKFSGDSVKPMTPVYAEFSGSDLRIKWTEEHTEVKLDDLGEAVRKPQKKNIILVADLAAGTAELRLDPPETFQPHQKQLGKTAADAYYDAYLAKARDVLGCEMTPVAIDRVIPNLVREEDARVVRIHIDNHENQTDLVLRAKSLRADVRDQEEWRKLYNEYGHTWTWEYQMLYWLPKPSGGALKRELYAHLNAAGGYMKLNADCSDDEVAYAVSQIRARQK